MSTITKAINEAFSKEYLIPFKASFRASDFPYCGKEHFLIKKYGDTITDSWNFYSEFYTTQGVAIHKVVQNYLGLAGLLYGHWECEKCKYTVHFGVGPQMCPSCDVPMHYKELEISRDLFGMSGFVDGVIPISKSVLEIKTKSASLLDKMKEAVFIEWACQASSYVSALNEQYGMDLNKVTMLYISRDNPRKYKVFEYDAITNMLEEQIKAKKEGDLLIAEGVCPEGICGSMVEGKEEYHCKLAPICFSPNFSSK